MENNYYQIKKNYGLLNLNLKNQTKSIKNEKSNNQESFGSKKKQKSMILDSPNLKPTLPNLKISNNLFNSNLKKDDSSLKKRRKHLNNSII